MGSAASTVKVNTNRKKANIEELQDSL